MGLENLDEMPSQSNSGGTPTYTQAECFEAVREFIRERGYWSQTDFDAVDEYPTHQVVRNHMEIENPSMIDMLHETGAINEFVSFKEPELERWNPREKNQKLVQLACQMVEEQPGRSVRDVYYGMKSKGLDVESGEVEEVMEKGRRYGWIDPAKVFDMSKRPTQAYSEDSGEPAEYLEESLSQITNGYFRDWWEETDVRVQVWMEKQSLEPFVKPICDELNVPLELWSGYWSDARIYRKCRELIRLLSEGCNIKILYFGDFNTNGLHIPVATQNIMRHYGIDLGRDEDEMSDSSNPTYFDIWPYEGAIKPGIRLQDANITMAEVGAKNRFLIDWLLEKVMMAPRWEREFGHILDELDFTKEERNDIWNSIFAGTIEFRRVALTVDQITNEFVDLPQEPNPYDSDKSQEERKTLESHITSHLDDPDVAIELNALKEYYPDRFEGMLRESITAHLDEEVMERVKEETEEQKTKIEESISVDANKLAGNGDSAED